MIRRLRCDGCGSLELVDDLNSHPVTSGRDVRYCDQCDALRETYGIRLEEHEHYCLPALADQLAEGSE